MFSPLSASSLHDSSSETDKPPLVERILEVPKSYIYLPEKGEILATDTNAFMLML